MTERFAIGLLSLDELAESRGLLEVLRQAVEESGCDSTTVRVAAV